MQSLTAFLLASILALALVPAPQSQKKSPPEEKKECGTVIPPGQFEAELARKGIAALAAAPPTDAPYYLPMTIHIVHRSNGADGLTLDLLDVVMRNLNQMWAQVGIQFFIYGDIDHINDDNLVTIPNDLDAQNALRQVNVVPNTINVYFTELVGLCGQASLTKSPVQGVLISNSCMDGTTLSGFGIEVFAHEMGHYFDLFHTNETWKDNNGNPTKVECPSGSNCSSAGDLLCDTPADPGLFASNFFRVDENCVYDNSASLPANCDGTPYNPPTRNLMSLSRKNCRNEFTPEQINKVLGVLRDKANRKNLITSGARYVSPLASNSNSKCTYTAPCRTAAKAVSAAQYGDFIFLKPGVHRASTLGGKQVTLNRWGTEGVVEIVP